MDMDAKTAMLHLQQLDPRICIRLSPYTNSWYVEDEEVIIEISNGAIISGITSHSDTPEQAVLNYLERLQEPDGLETVVVTHKGTQRRHWRWNGATFVEIPVWSRS